jgi:hypothetical protein
MPLSADKIQRSRDAVSALTALLREYSDVLVVLDYVSVDDILQYDDDDTEIDQPLEQILTDDDIEAILWRLGRHAGVYETSANILPSIVQYVLDDYERKAAQK